MEYIEKPIHKDCELDDRLDPDLRTLNELLHLVEIRLLEAEKRISFLEGRGRDVQFIEVVRCP